MDYYRNFFLGTPHVISKFKYLNGADRGQFCFDDVHLRLLLIKDNRQDEIERLLNGGKLLAQEETALYKKGKKSLSEKEKRDSLVETKKTFASRTYWDEDVKAVPWKQRLKIGNLRINNEFNTTPKSREIEGFMKKHYARVQIVPAPDFESALVLLSLCKFDIILLDKIDLFVFLSLDFETDANDGIVQNLLQSNRDLTKEDLKEFRNIVKLNRGPLDKYWVLPLSKDFYTELQKNNVRLTDHRWNIGFGADPFEDDQSYEFLYRVNEMIDLQLRLSVYSIDTLLVFLLYTCEDMLDRLKTKLYDASGNHKTINEIDLFFDGFQDFMGAEYANFIKRYGARKLVERDAKKSGDEANKSLFSTYVCDNFYNKKVVETELNRLMRDFYHQAASMFNDRYGRQRLRESFEALRIFITYNGSTNNLDAVVKDKLINGLKFLRVVIDSDFYLVKIDEWLDKHPNINI